MHRTLESLVALATGLALVVLTAAPGAATVGTATAGTATFNFAPPWVLDLAPGGTGSCPAVASTTLDVTMTTATSGTATLDMLPAAIGLGVTDYFIHLVGTGSVTISGSSITIGPLSLSGEGYPETSPGSCVPDLTAPRCPGSGHIAASPTLSGTWSGTVSPPSLSGTAVLGGNSGMVATGCAPPFQLFNGKTMSISNLTVPF